jgi:ketosteroid isomerase-like protein
MKCALWLMLLCPLAYASPCPKEQAKDEATLIQMEHTWASALEKHDASALECILASDFEEAGPDGQLFDRSNMLNRARNTEQVHYELSEMHAHVYGDAGFVRGMGVAAGSDGKVRAKTRFTDIFVYRDGRWQCVAGQESLFPATHS